MTKQSLQDAFQNKTLIPIVAAGVSMSLRNHAGEPLFPSWKRLLELAAEKLREEGKVDEADAVLSMVKIKKFQQAADFAKEYLTGSLWHDFFRSHFDITSDQIDPASLALPQAVWTLSQRIITLNYERVLRFACPKRDDLEELDNDDHSALSSFINNKLAKPAVWHLHGRFSKPEKLIFTSDSYDKLYLEENSSYKAALTSFHNLCLSAQFLFIGCSLADAELLQQINQIHQLFAENTGPHYALVREADMAAISAKLKGLPIDLLPFKEFGQDLIDAILAISQPTSTAPLVAAAPPAPVAPAPATTPAPVSTTTRIALLSAAPIGEAHDYQELFDSFRSWDGEFHHLPLNLTTLNNLANFDYVFIPSKLIKQKILLEDEEMQRSTLSISELEANLGNVADGRCKGVLLFLNHSKCAELDAADCARLQSAMLILPALNKEQLRSLHFKLFKKPDFKYIAEHFLANDAQFQTSSFFGKHKDEKHCSPLSDLIDPKNTQHFIGRSTDLAHLTRDILALRSKGGVLTIKGSGGIGKTMTVKKLAVALAQRGHFKHGIDFVDCEFISDVASFQKKVVSGFGLQSAQDIAYALKTTVEPQQRLIILDNAESLLNLAERAAIEAFIGIVCEYASIVITSREALGLAFEKITELRRFTIDEAYALFVQTLAPRTPSKEEERLLREEILDTQLDHNPLAITLVAKNLPRAKSLSELHQDLQNDIFAQAQDGSAASFAELAEGNIERKKSLYASIYFSYRHLEDAQKMALEILSLFPDGISLHDIKQVTDLRRAQLRQPKNKDDKPVLPEAKPVITDAIVKALENKSLCQHEYGLVKLQSIVSKFAGLKWGERSASEKLPHYRNALAHHLQLATYFLETIPNDNVRVGETFHPLQNNFFKTLSYAGETHLDEDAFLFYVASLAALAVHINANAALKQVLASCPRQCLTTQQARRCFQVILIWNQYFAGEFDAAFATLKALLPASEVAAAKPTSSQQRLMYYLASGLYQMEGELFARLKYDLQNKISVGQTYPDSLMQAGMFDTDLLALCKTDFFGLEAQHTLGKLNMKMVSDYLTKLYPKNHLAVMEAHYLKAKLGVVEAKKIKKLVSVNPYTKGLQTLMLAFAASTTLEKNALFEEALPHLQHIKYYYVEALLHYARHLQASGQAPRFAQICEEGQQLASQHHYRWLRYQFEALTDAAMPPYHSELYPLPEALDIAGYIRWLIKDFQQRAA